MVNVTMTYKTDGKVVSEKYLTMGELKMSELGYTSVRYQKTINMQNFESLVLGVEVQLPNDAELRKVADQEAALCFHRAAELAETYLNNLEKRLR